jgi:HEAT repeat protein
VHRINRILNLSSREWPRILVAWSMVFLTRFGFIVGWSVLIASFLSKVGVHYLPGLFMANATMVVLGTLLFRKIIPKVKREALISFTIIGAAATLLSSIFFIQSSSFFFFSLLVISESIFLAQLSILVSLFNEDLFTPLESQRTFPIIESAETIGGLMGGLVLSVFASHIPSYKFIIIWAIALLLILPIVLRFNPRTMVAADFETKSKDIKSVRKSFEGINKVPFLRGLMLVVLLHWAIMNMVEFQYTTAIEQEVLMASSFSPDHALYFEQAVAQRLGALHAVFNGAALFIQLLLASRIITSFGIISSILIHPVVTFLNLILLTLRFSFFSAVLTRGSYELTGLLFKNAYDSSYYAIPREDRDEVKEMMQGLFKPFGAILGTGLIMFIALNLNGQDQQIAINIVLIGMALLLGIVVLKLRNSYTDLSEHNLSKKKELATRLNAIEILAQNGHQFIPSSLSKLLKRKNEPEAIKVAILKTLGEQQKAEYLPHILEHISHESDDIRLAAAQALSTFEHLKKELKSHLITRHQVIEQIKESLKEETLESVRHHLVELYFKLDPESLTRFLVKSIKNDPSQRASSIHMLKLFDDPGIKHFLEPYLESKDMGVRAACIVSLWQFDELHSSLLHLLRQMFESSKSRVLCLAISTCGELHLEEMRERVTACLADERKVVHEASLLALAQMEDDSVFLPIVDRLSQIEHEWFEQAHHVLSRVPKSTRDKLVRQRNLNIQEQISSILRAHSRGYETMKKLVLKRLKSLYESIGAHDEAHRIQLALDSSD